MEAKRALADMEANGRIGGEPVDMPMDDTPTVAVSTGGYIDGYQQQNIMLAVWLLTL